MYWINKFFFSLILMDYRMEANEANGDLAHKSLNLFVFICLNFYFVFSEKSQLCFHIICFPFSALTTWAEEMIILLYCELLVEHKSHLPHWLMCIFYHLKCICCWFVFMSTIQKVSFPLDWWTTLKNKWHRALFSLALIWIQLYCIINDFEK